LTDTLLTSSLPSLLACGTTIITNTIIIIIIIIKKGTISCIKEGVKFSVSGDLGKGNVTVRNSTTADKEEDQVRITMEEPVTLTFALRYLSLFSKVSEWLRRRLLLLLLLLLLPLLVA